MAHFRKSLYREVLDKLRAEIIELPEGTKLPPIDELCEKLRVSRTIVREVLVALEREGLIVRKQGLGTFVIKNEAFVHTGIEYLRGLFNIISSSGRAPSFLMNECEKLFANREIAKHLNLELNAQIAVAKQLYAADGIPVLYAETFVAISRLPGYFEKFAGIFHANSEKILFDILEKEYGVSIKYAVAEIKTFLSDKKLSKLLEIPKGTPLVFLSQIHFDGDGIPWMYSEDYVNTSIFTLKLVRKRI